MTLKEQILSELREKDRIYQAEISDLRDTIYFEEFFKSTLGDTILDSAAASACEHRQNEARKKIQKIEKYSQWISEMLSQYDH